METQTNDLVRFRGLRQLVGNLIVASAALVLFVVLAISTVVAPPSIGSEEWGGSERCALCGALCVAAGLLRLRTAFTVEIAPETLTYRTLLTTVRFRRSEVTGIGLKDRYRGMAKLSQPFLEMRDGRTVWLADMGQGKLIAPASTMQADLVSAVETWIS
jgi:hypothetical protein